MMLMVAVQRYGQRVARQKAMFERLDSAAPAVPVNKENEELNDREGSEESRKDKIWADKNEKVNKFLYFCEIRDRKLVIYYGGNKFYVGSAFAATAGGKVLQQCRRAAEPG